MEQEAAQCRCRRTHGGPWTEEQYLDRPQELYYCELLDGDLLLNPGPTLRHQRILNRLCAALDRLRPDHLEVIANFTVRVGPSRLSYQMSPF